MYVMAPLTIQYLIDTKQKAIQLTSKQHLWKIKLKHCLADLNSFKAACKGQNTQCFQHDCTSLFLVRNTVLLTENIINPAFIVELLS